MITCMLVDDEPLNLHGLEKMINRYCPDLSIIGKVSTLQEASQLIRSLHPQLVFMDIEMPRGNAFELLDNLGPIQFEIIFVTAYDRFAVKAFKYRALDYLLKPIDIDELKEAVQKAQERIHTPEARLPQSPSHLRSSDRYLFSKIGLRTSDGLLFYAIEDILYCSAVRSYTKFVFRKGKSLLVNGNLKEFENLLPNDCFCRVHDSHLVNLNHIMKYYSGKGAYIEMTDGQIIEISLRKRADFLSRVRY